MCPHVEPDQNTENYAKVYLTFNIDAVRSSSNTDESALRSYFESVDSSSKSSLIPSKTQLPVFGLSEVAHHHEIFVRAD